MNKLEKLRILVVETRIRITIAIILSAFLFAIPLDYTVIYGATNFLVYLDQYDLDMRIEYPDNWAYREYSGSSYSSEDYTTVFEPAAEISISSNLSTTPSDVYVLIGRNLHLPYKSMPLDLYFDYEKKSKINQGYNITNTGKTFLTDKTPAYEMDVSTVNTGHPEKQVIVLMNQGSKSFYFIYSATPEKFNTYLPVAQQMFMRLSLIGQ